MQKSFNPLLVSERKLITTDAAVIYFDVPEHLKQTYIFKPGQYITLEVEVRGQVERRAYSLCTSPNEDDFAVCVKRLKGGLVSNYLLDRDIVGKIITVLPPQGRFLAKINASQRKTYYLFGAGSGITPLMSIAKTVLDQEPGSAVHLLYGNRNQDSIIFKEELDQLASEYEGQFTVEHILSQPLRKKAGGIKGLLGKSTPIWFGKKGRIDAKVIDLFLKENESRTGDNNAYFICGPEGMIHTVEDSLLAFGVEHKTIYKELFVVDRVKPEEKVQSVAGNEVVVTLDGETINLNVEGTKTILEALIDKGYNPPYSCGTGACSTCIAKVIKGEVSMDVNHALDPDEVVNGYVLSCQSHPVSKDVEISYDE